jgi:hypothetical protein
MDLPGVGAAVEGHSNGVVESHSGGNSIEVMHDCPTRGIGAARHEHESSVGLEVVGPFVLLEQHAADCPFEFECEAAGRAVHYGHREVWHARLDAEGAHLALGDRIGPARPLATVDS